MRATSSAISFEWFASVSYVAPPMCGVSTTFVQLLQRMVGRQVLALEVVEAGAAEVSRLERGGERIDVVQQRTRRC